MTRADTQGPAGVSEITPDELAAQWEKRGAGLKPAQLKETGVPLRDLVTAPKVFGTRDPNEQPWHKRDHLFGLVESLQHRGDLDRVDVFAVAGVTYVVEGHARVDAYRKVYPKGDRLVPARYLQGTLGSALRHSVRFEAHARLPLTISERLEGAWRLVTHNAREHTQLPFEIAKDAGVSVATVRRMAEALKLDASLRAVSWAQVCGKLDPGPQLEDDLAARWADRLHTQFGRGPALQCAAFLIALDDAYPDLRERRFTLERGLFVEWLKQQGYSVTEKN